MRSQLYQLFFGGDVGRKLTIADRLFRLYGGELQQDAGVRAGMTRFHPLYRELTQQMLAMGLDRTCSACGEKNGGGCCSLAFAAETDVVQLLINMLAGVEVRIRQENGAECCYLGKTGCIFMAKPMFCLNYNCAIIRFGNNERDLRLLEILTGRLLSAQQDLEKSLLDFFQMKPAIFAQMGEPNPE